MEELNELKEKVNRLSAAAKEEYDAAAAKLESYFKSLLKDFRVRVDVDLGAAEHGFDLGDYECVWEESVDSDTSLDDIWSRLQHGSEDCPEDYQSRSMSGQKTITS